MTEETPSVHQWLARDASKPYAYLTTTGRRTGQSHRIEIWFSVEAGRMYMLAGGRDRADWVRNIQAIGSVTVEVGDEAHAGIARVLEPGTHDDMRARELLVAKYRQGDNLDEWGRTSLAVIIDFPAAHHDATEQDVMP